MRQCGAESTALRLRVTGSPCHSPPAVDGVIIAALLFASSLTSHLTAPNTGFVSRLPPASMRTSSPATGVMQDWSHQLLHTRHRQALAGVEHIVTSLTRANTSPLPLLHQHPLPLPLPSSSLTLHAALLLRDRYQRQQQTLHRTNAAVLEELKRRQAALEEERVECSYDDWGQGEAQQPAAWEEAEEELEAEEQEEEEEEAEERVSDRLWFAQSLRYDRWYERRDTAFGDGMRAYKLMLAEWDRQQQLQQEQQ